MQNKTQVTGGAEAALVELEDDARKENKIK
jgi:hypothetical protein